MGEESRASRACVSGSIGFEHVEERGILGQAEALILAFEPRLLLRRIGIIVAKDPVIPGCELIGRAGSAMRTDPFGDLVVAVALGDIGLKIRTLEALPAEEHVIERAIEMIFADSAEEERAALVYSASEDVETADLRLGAARRLLGKVQAGDVRIGRHICV